MEKINELKQDVAELEDLLGKASRQKVKDILSIESRKLITEIVKLEEQLKSTPTPTDGVQTAKVAPVTRCYQVRVNNYAWDQSNKFVKFYVTLKNVQTIPAENVFCTFTSKSFELQVKGLDNKDYIMNINNLLKQVNPEASNWKIKSDTVIVNVAKVEPVSWSHVTEFEKRASDAKKIVPNSEKTSSDPGSDLMSIMKNVYEQGDDEMKRSIAKAWTEVQNKGGAGPGMNF